MSFALSTVFEILLVCAVLWALKNEDKFVAFEDKLAVIVAHAIIKHNKKKELKRRLEADCRRAEIRRSKMHIVNSSCSSSTRRSGRVA